MKTMGSIRNSLFMFQEVRDIALSVARALGSKRRIKSSSFERRSKCGLRYLRIDILIS